MRSVARSKLVMVARLTLNFPCSSIYFLLKITKNINSVTISYFHHLTTNFYFIILITFISEAREKARKGHSDIRKEEKHLP